MPWTSNYRDEEIVKFLEKTYDYTGVHCHTDSRKVVACAMALFISNSGITKSFKEAMRKDGEFVVDVYESHLKKVEEVTSTK